MFPPTTRLPARTLRLGLVIVAALAAFAGPASAAQSPTTSPAQRLASVRSRLFAAPESSASLIPELKAILDDDPRSAEAHMLLGLAYRNLGSETMVGEAKAEMQQALDLDPTFIPARLFLAQIYFDLGRYANVREEADIALRAFPTQVQFLALSAESERRLGHPDTALDFAERALRADATFAEARFYLGLALLDLGRRSEAIAALEQLARSAPALPSEVYLNLGQAYLDDGRLPAAVATLTRGAELAPADRDLHIALARAQRLSGALVAAERQLTLAAGTGQVQVTPAYQRTETALHLEWGRLRLRQGRLADAVTALGRAIDMDPASGPSHQALAEAYGRQGRRDLARTEAAAAARLGAPVSADVQRLIDDAPATGATREGAR